MRLSNALIYDEFMHKGTTKPKSGWPKDCKYKYLYVDAIIGQLNLKESRRTEAKSQPLVLSSDLD